MDVTLLASDGSRFVATGNKTTGALLVDGTISGGSTEATQTEILEELQTGVSAALGTTNNVGATDGTGVWSVTSLLKGLWIQVNTLRTNIVLASGNAKIGKVEIDQTAVGTTDSVTVKASGGIGSLTETAPASDTASSGLNGRLQRIAQNLTAISTKLNASIAVTGAFWQATQPVSGTVTANIGTVGTLATAANQTSANTLMGAVTETAPVSDTASSGLNGRLQRIAQNLTSLMTLLPVSLGTKTAANSLAVTLASDGTAGLALGTVADSAATNSTSSWSIIALLKGIMLSYTSPTIAKTTALSSSLVAKASSGTLLGFTVYNDNANAQFIQIHNTTSLPADGAVPIDIIRVEGKSSNSYEGNGIVGDAYSTGITICNSSTAATKTIGAADCWIVARYR